MCILVHLAMSTSEATKRVPFTRVHVLLPPHTCGCYFEKKFATEGVGRGVVCVDVEEGKGVIVSSTSDGVNRLSEYRDCIQARTRLAKGYWQQCSPWPEKTRKGGPW